MQGNSRSVSSNQQGIHDSLPQLVKRYLTTHSQRPVQAHTQAAFEQVQDWLGQDTDRIILDSCCGIGESTSRLAHRYPKHKIIGIDKSALRVAKHQYHFAAPDKGEVPVKDAPPASDTKAQPASDAASYLIVKDNYCVVRADVIDFWRLARQAQWHIDGHYLLYPNPYPKASQIQKRWYASAPLKDLLLLKGRFEVRSNWKLYLEEFQEVLKMAGVSADITPVTTDNAMTPFERKYQNSGQTCWQLNADLHQLNPQSWHWDD